MKLEITGLFLFLGITAYNIVSHTTLINIDGEYVLDGEIDVSFTRNASILKSLSVSKNRHRSLSSEPRKCCLIFIHCLLATQISDIETNPGPADYPCGTCSQEVTWNDKGILCDSCDTWHHINCQGIGDSTYDCLSNASFMWYCSACGSPNYSTSLSVSLNSMANRSVFSPLESLTESSPEDLSQYSTPNRSSQNSSFHNKQPNATSTPHKRKNTSNRKKLQHTERFTILNINCRSLRNKVPELHQMINQVKPDIVCCTETWLKPDIFTAEIFPKSLNFQVCRDDRTDSQGGGVLIAINNKLISQEQPQLKTNCNIIWSKLSIPGHKDIYVSSYYKPHENDTESLTEFWESISKIPRNSPIWILGDFNLPDMDWTNGTPKNNCKHKNLYDNFNENSLKFNLEQIVKIPTRANNILDLFLTNTPAVVHSTQTLPSLGSSDHDIIFHEINLKRGRPLQTKREIKSFNKADWKSFKEDMKIFSSKLLQSDCTDPNTSWILLKNEISKLSNKYIPSRQSKSRPDLPWISHDIVKNIRKRDKMYRKIKNSPNPNLTNKFKNLKANIQRQIRNSYYSYLESIIFTDNTNERHRKKFYSFIKHNKTESSGIAPLSCNGQIFTDPVEKANILNDQFESVFSRPQPLSLKQLAKSASSSLTHPPMPPISICVNGVDKLLQGLNPHKAAGPDKMPPIILKELHNEIAPVLTMIFKSSLESGIIPDDWRHAVIAPIYKKGQKSKASNYRPISLTCIASKLLEHILVSNIMSYFESFNILSPQQHGFRSKHSCETQLIGFTQEIADSLENGQQNDVIIMDFSKAFDKVDHHKLIHKLKNLGIDNNVTLWIKSFLSNRSQQVLVENKMSDKLPVQSGVPQGSVLGPCLFLSYINDLPESIRSRARLFADDTIIYLTIKSKSCAESLQNDLYSLEKWEQEWSMEFNPEKCEVLRISRKKQPIIFPYSLHNKQLRSSDSSKYLGITLNEKLTWSNHIENITAKASNTLKFIKRNVKTNNKEVKEMAYKTYVRPQLEYCSTVWHPWQQYLTYKIEMVQRQAARYVLNDFGQTSSVTNMLATLNWQTLEQRRNHSSLVMLYKIRGNLVSVDHHHLLPTRNLNFLIPQSKTQSHLHSFFPRAIRLWNGLPFDIQHSPSLQVFVDRLAVRVL